MLDQHGAHMKLIAKAGGSSANRLMSARDLRKGASEAASATSMS